MKNFKKVFFALMVVFLVVGFIGCKTESDPPKAPVVTNNFKGNVFVAEYSVESYSEIWGYIEFIDDTNGKMGIPNYDEESNPIITNQTFTYSVTDDVATLNATMDGEEVTVTTSKLTDGIFTFSTEDVDEETGETYSILITCTKGDKSLFDVWTVLYEEQEQMKDFFYEFEDYVELLVEGDDYSKDDATKTITLTASGYEKVQDAMGGGSGEEDSGEVTGWTVMYSGITLQTFESLEAAETFASNSGLEENVDYTVDYETQIITLTAAGAEKVGMGGDTEGGDSGEVYYYTHNGELIGGKSTLEDFPYEADHYGLVEGTDYTIDYENKYIKFTDSGVEKLGMGGGSDDETWTVLDPEGNTLETFESIEAANAFASSIGLVQDDDFAIDFDNQTITLTAEGLAKVQAAMGGSEG